MKRIAGLLIITGVFVVIYIALAVTYSMLFASLTFLIAFATAAVLITGISLASGEDVF